MTVVHKFGGTSVADAACLRRVAEIVARERERSLVVVVASAAAGVTDILVEMAREAHRGRADACTRLLDALRERHAGTLADLGGDAATEADLARLLAEASRVIEGAILLGEISRRASDRLVALGEKMSVRLLALALQRSGIAARPMDADAFLDTDDSFGGATPLGEVANRAIRVALRPILESGLVPVVTGFIGRASDGATTTLDRGGSDLTATVLAAAMDASEVVLWTDVDGVLTADPGLVPEARVLPHLHYREATELGFYGARVLHPRSMIPVVKPGIPVRIRNTFASERPGTLIDARFSPGSHPVKAISAVPGQALVSLEGKGMAGVPGVAARCFSALASESISVTMISQSSSESSICLAVPEGDAGRAEQALKRAFRSDLARGLIEEVVVQRRVALVAAVGLGMARTPGVAARIFGALGRRRVNVLAIAQGSSELNVSLAIDERDIAAALRALHTEFGLGLRDTGEDAPRAMDLIVLGLGNIGRALVRLVQSRGTHFFERFGIEARVAGVADRSGYLFDPRGIGQERLEKAMLLKSAGGALADLPGSVVADDPIALVREALSFRLARPVVVDVSDSEATAGLFLEAFRLGADVVTANKKPLAGDPVLFRRIRDTAREHGRLFRAEATVGAGLPVLDTLEMLMGAGDRVLEVTGCLSGTLSYVLSRVEAGARLGDAVSEAVRSGIAEPDPAVDLSGEDVGRKAVILGRMTGLAPDGTPRVEGLVDPVPLARSLDDFLGAIEPHGEVLARRIAEARARGRALRYLARVGPSLLEVGLVEVPADSPLGGLRGTDNMIVFRTERYDERPLVISGPGAGAEVTAMGVLGDLMRVAAERK